MKYGMKNYKTHDKKVVLLPAPKPPVTSRFIGMAPGLATQCVRRRVEGLTLALAALRRRGCAGGSEGNRES